MIEFSALQLVGMICILLSSGILIGAVIGYNTPGKNGDQS